MCIHYVSTTSPVHCVMRMIAYHHLLCHRRLLPSRVHHAFVFFMYVQCCQFISMICLAACHRLLCSSCPQTRGHHVLEPLLITSWALKKMSSFRRALALKNLFINLSKNIRPGWRGCQAPPKNFACFNDVTVLVSAGPVFCK